LGYNVDEIIGTTLFNYMTDKEAERTKAFFKEKSRVAEPFAGWKVTLFHKNGQPVTMEINAAPILDRNGRFSGWHGFDRDITEGVLAEEALRESEEKYRNLVNLTPDPITILQDDRHQLVNSAFTDLFGYTQHDVDNGLGVLALIQDDYQDTLRKRLEDRFAGKKIPRSLRVDMIAKDGKIIPCDSSGALIQYGGRPAILVLIRDISERMQAEEALKESEERFKTLVTNIPGVTYRCACDSDWTMEYISDEVENICGHPASDFLQNRVRSYASIIHPDDTEMVENVVHDGVKKKSPYTIDYRIVHTNGSVHHVYERGQAVFDEHGEVAWLDGAIFDITERKKAEEALQRSEMELHHLSSQLLEAHEKESKRIGSELHDGIAQTLSAIKMGAELSLMQLGQKDVAEAAKVLESIVPMAQRAVEEVRRISRNLRPSILDNLGILATISWLCKEFEEIYSGVSIVEQIDIREEDVPDSLKIIIFRILQEALNNIAKHSQAKLVRLSFKGTDDKIELTVHDDGTGFDVEDMLYGDQSERGLGIASMKERAELSDGSFSIESGKGAGATVRASWGMS